MSRPRSIPADLAVPDSSEPAVLSRCDRQSAAPPGNVAVVAIRLAEDRDRVAIGLNDTVVRRLFSAGLALETALALMDDHPAAGRVRAAIGELDLAIKDVRHVLFDDQGTAQGIDK